MDDQQSRRWHARARLGALLIGGLVAACKGGDGAGAASRAEAGAGPASIYIYLGDARREDFETQLPSGPFVLRMVGPYACDRGVCRRCDDAAGPACPGSVPVVHGIPWTEGNAAGWCQCERCADPGVGCDPECAIRCGPRPP